MIHSLRQRHRVAVITLGVLLPIALVAGISGRHVIPRQIVPIDEITNQSANGDRAVWERSDLWPGMTIHTGLFAQTTNFGAFSVEISAKEPLLKADVLVYWVPAETKTEKSVPTDARLLGTYSGITATRLSLPPEAARESGALLLYSLPNHEMVARSQKFTARPNY